VIFKETTKKSPRCGAQLKDDCCSQARGLSSAPCASYVCVPAPYCLATLPAANPLEQPANRWRPCVKDKEREFGLEQLAGWPQSNQPRAGRPTTTASCVNQTVSWTHAALTLFTDAEFRHHRGTNSTSFSYFFSRLVFFTFWYFSEFFS